MSERGNLHLDLQIVKISDIQFGEETAVRDGTLFINKEEMLEAIADPYFEHIDVDLARPGESVRIIPVKDVIEPRIKMNAEGTSFPGFFGGYEDCGEGVTKVFRGCAVVTAGKVVGFQEGIIDMSGIGAEYTYYSELNNVVVVADTPDGVHPTEHESHMRVIGLAAAHYLAEKCRDAAFDEAESYELTPCEKKLPKVGLITMLLAQGLMHDNYLYGVDAKKIQSTYVNPTEYFDGALVNGCCVIASDKVTTWDHQNNPMVKNLFAHHGKEIEFAGCIVAPTNPILKDKERNANGAVRIAKSLGWDAAFITEEGAGNPEADLMMIIRGLEKAGIKTVGMLSAVCGEEGITDSTKEADAIVIAGTDVDDNIALKPLEKVIGYAEQVDLICGGGDDCYQPDGSMTVNIVAIMGAMNQNGNTKLKSILI